jgi:hypothetical protein
MHGNTKLRFVFIAISRSAEVSRFHLWVVEA